MQISDWHEWHDGYDVPSSELAARLRVVRAHVAAVVEEASPGPVTVASMCAGEGREVIGAVAQHPRRADVRGRLVEMDPRNAATARQAGRDAGLNGLEVVTGDASQSDSYLGVRGADMVVISGLFGHLDDEDQMRTVDFLRQLCRAGGSVVWTFTALRPERVPNLRRFFVERGFDELDFETLPGDELALTVARSRHRGPQEPFQPGATIFTFGSSRRDRTSGTPRASASPAADGSPSGG